MVRKTGDMKQPTKKELRDRIAALEAESAGRLQALEENDRLREEAHLTYSYTCRDGHEETETLAIDEAIEAICEYRFRAENAESELAALRSAAYERGAREFAEWLPNIELAIREDHEPYVARCMTIMDGCARFLASRGTGIAEGEGKKEGE